MQIIKELIGSLKQDAPIKRIMIGAHWTAVSSRFCGMASTVMSQKPHGEEMVRDAGQLHYKSARELAEYAQSNNPLEACIGLAAINSLLEIPQANITVINAFKVVAEKGKGKHVAIFGHFPYLKEIKATARQLSICELTPAGEELPLERVAEMLPDAEVVAVTSNSIINHTLDSILPHIRSDAFSVLVGPSTPLSPILFDYGFNLLAGVRILDEELLFQSISQAATFRQTSGVEQVTISKE